MPRMSVAGVGQDRVNTLSKGHKASWGYVSVNRGEDQRARLPAKTTGDLMCEFSNSNHLLDFWEARLDTKQS